MKNPSISPVALTTSALLVFCSASLAQLTPPTPRAGVGAAIVVTDDAPGSVDSGGALSYTVTVSDTDLADENDPTSTVVDTYVHCGPTITSSRAGSYNISQKGATASGGKQWQLSGTAIGVKRDTICPDYWVGKNEMYSGRPRGSFDESTYHTISILVKTKQMKEETDPEVGQTGERDGFANQERYNSFPSSISSAAAS